ncbi:MAG: electron transfer flavoprotein subunit beta/FixA family protein [Bacteroidales bacterium]|jgi:electron transfer flavoprotein beta subunit|nr:electron transfer flavoprotein subunit beta/FixA family protein [Bacteroidales bacterium]MDD4213334.1 electron transfer flavoprotein subunit beta/FixA family protein [Bacteroidales bacterium]
MKILVSLSNVPDTTTKIRLTADKKNMDMEGVQWVINPWDELALSRAIELKEKYPAVIEKITVIHVGGIHTEPTIRKALAMGADDAIRVDTEAKDAYYVAGQLAEVIKNNPYEIILCGIESSDYNGCSVGGMLAEFLGFASVSSVSFLDIENENVTLNREIDGGYEKIYAKFPFVAIVQKGIAIEPKIPTMRGIMTARSKPLQVIHAAQIDFLTEEISYDLPASKTVCKMVAAENAGDLIDLLRSEAKVI